jgi:Fic family protein
VPNETIWLPEEARKRMRQAVEDAGGQKLDASTYSRAIAERFLIDLSWASSGLEGNTYDHLSTEILVKYGQSASGRDRLETAMILNHKAAISEMIDGLSRNFPDVTDVKRRHVLMMRDLMDPSELGVIRRSGVQITATSYRPTENYYELMSGLSELLGHAEATKDPFEASFVLLTGLSYLQSFGDGNKRMGRMLSNEPLLRAGLPPLSFIGIDKTPYILGLIAFYETGDTDLLGTAIAESYEATAADYVRSISVQRVPHALELRERDRIATILGIIFKQRIQKDDIASLVDDRFADLSEGDRTKLTAIISENADSASPATAFLYGVTEEDISERNDGHKPGGISHS